MTTKEDMMTDKTKTPRELAPGKAIEKLKYLADDLTDADSKAIEAYRAELTATFAERLAKKRGAILRKVHPAAREAVMREVGITDAVEPDGTELEGEIEAAAELAGTKPYEPGPAARAARGIR